MRGALDAPALPSAAHSSPQAGGAAPEPPPTPVAEPDLAAQETRGPVSDRSPPAGAQPSAPAAANAKMTARVIAPQIAAAISQSAPGAVELRLDPPELGLVRLSIVVANDAVAAVIAAERPEIEALMRRHADELRAELSQAGFGDVDLGFGEDGAGDAPQQGAQTGAGDAGEDKTTPRGRWAATDRLDMRI